MPVAINHTNDDWETVESLSRVEHLLVFAMRAVALGREDCPQMDLAFRQVCRRQGAETLQTYAIFVKYVALLAVRRLQVHLPGCFRLGDDERAMLDIVRSAQLALVSHDETILRAQVRALTGGRCDEGLVLVVQRLGGLLGAAGLVLPSRTRFSSVGLADHASASLWR